MQRLLLTAIAPLAKNTHALMRDCLQASMHAEWALTNTANALATYSAFSAHVNNTHSLLLYIQ